MIKVHSFFSFFYLGKKSLFQPKYTDIGRKTVFDEYFGSLQINDSLTNLIIPAYNESMGNQTHLFNRKEIEMCNDEEYEIIEHVNEPDDPKDV